MDFYNVFNEYYNTIITIGYLIDRSLAKKALILF